MCLLAGARTCVRLQMCMCVHVRTRVGSHACAGSRTRGCACVRVYMHV